MTTFQKIATLIFRLFALGMIFYGITIGIFVAFTFPFPTALISLVPLLGGIVLYLMSFTLAYFITRDFEK